MPLPKNPETFIKEMEGHGKAGMPRKPGTEIPTQIFIRNMSPRLKAHFKAYCKARGMSMGGAIKRMMYLLIRDKIRL